MGYNEELTGAPPGTEVPQELLEEMLWFFRVEDGKWWTQHKERNLVEAPFMVPSSAADCTFPLSQGLRLRGLTTQRGLAKSHPPLLRAGHSFTHPSCHSQIFIKFLLGTRRRSQHRGYRREKNKNLRPHGAYLLVKETENQQMTKTHGVLAMHNTEKNYAEKGNSRCAAENIMWSRKASLRRWCLSKACRR